LAGGEVPRIVFNNPVAGFSLAVPEDWEMATGNAGNTEIAIDASTGASLLAQPAMWFFYSPRPPQQQAEQLARDLQTLGADTPQVDRTAQVDEWEIRADFPITRVGLVMTRWLCRHERGMSYVIGVAVRSELAQRYQEDIDVAFQSCQLIEHPILQVFREPRENAYRIMLPQGWNWEGEIIRTASVPGYFQWKARRQDNLVGCFTNEPGVLNIGTPYFSAHEAAAGIVLDGLRQLMPDAQLEQIHELPRIGDHIRTASRLAISGSDPRGDKVRADYLATEHGVQVRVRVDIVTWMPSMSNTPGLEGRGNWFLFTAGTWAPAAEFDEQYALARGVQASLQTSMEWKKRQFETVGDSIADRNSALDKANEGWDALIRDMERVPDPAGGPIQEVPNRDGQVWKDLDGVMWRVPPVQGLEDWVKNQGWAFIQ
jgi:hypothetical protein